MADLRIRDLRKTFGVHEVLKEINIEAKDGEFLVLLGPSGCGKSTLLNAIAGLETINSGDILIDGRPIQQREPKDRDIAMVFQSYALYPTMTVRKNIDFGMRVRGVPKSERDAAIARVAEVLQIGHLLDRRPGQLSGGQRQRVAMGRALVRSPKIFLFDEPLSNLDAKLRVEMRAEIKKLHQRLGATIVYVTHDQIEAMTLATKVVVMREGVIQQIGTPEEIYRSPANLYVAGFIGSPPANLVPARLVQSETRATILLRGEKDEDEIQFDAGPMSAALRPYVDRDVILGIRPESIAEAQGNHGATWQPFEVDVDVVEPTGADIYIVFNLAGATSIGRCAPRSRVTLGRQRLVLDVSGILIFDPTTEVLIHSNAPAPAEVEMPQAARAM